MLKHGCHCQNHTEVTPMDSSEYRRTILKRCASCGQELAVNSKWYCADCLQNQSDWHYNWYHSLSPEEKETFLLKKGNNQRSLRERRKAEGICTTCGKRKARTGKVSCALCADKSNRRKREAYMRKKEKVE